MKKLIIAVLFLAYAIPAFATIRYVDKDNACPGAGTTGDPYCSIANAVAVVAAGDTIRIRDSATPYAETLTITTEGTVNSPITVEPDSGHNPTLRNSGNGGGCANFWIIANYWIIQNLNFDATGVTPCVWGAILLHANGRDVIGHKILNNTFRAWGGPETPPTTAMSAVVISGGANGPTVGFWPRDILVQGNNFVDNRLISLTIAHSRNVTVENNTFSGTKCGRDSDATNELGVKAIYYNEGLVIRGNVFRDFAASSACGLTNQGNATYAAYWCDVGTSGTTPNIIEKNLIYNIDQGVNGFGNSNGISRASHGLFIEAGCGNHIVKNNVIYNIGNIGITQSFHVLNQTQPNLYYNNTIYAVDYGIFNKEGVATYANNIVKNATSAQVCHGCGSGSASLLNITMNYNQYDDGASQTAIGSWGGVVYNLTDWRTHCGCDANSIASSAAFVDAAGGNFNLTSTSPAIDAGSATYTPLYNGSAPDMGAFERFTALNAEVGEVATNKLVVNFGMNLNQPILVTNTTGWTWTGGTISSVAVTGSAQLTFTLSGAYGGGASTITYVETTGNATDSALIGNSLKQRLSGFASFTVTDNTGGAPAGSVALSHWRIYLLQGSSDSAWLPKCVEDSTDCIVSPGAKVWVRYKLRNSSGSDYTTFNLIDRWRFNGGSYAALTADYVNGVKVLGGTSQPGFVIADGTTLSADQLTGNETTNVACVANRSANSIPALSLVNGSETECARALDVSTAAVAGSIYEMCPYRDDGTALTCSTPVKLTVGSYQRAR